MGLRSSGHTMTGTHRMVHGGVKVSCGLTLVVNLRLHMSIVAGNVLIRLVWIDMAPALNGIVVSMGSAAVSIGGVGVGMRGNDMVSSSSGLVSTLSGGVRAMLRIRDMFEIHGERSMWMTLRGKVMVMSFREMILSEIVVVQSLSSVMLAVHLVTCLIMQGRGGIMGADGVVVSVASLGMFIGGNLVTCVFVHMSIRETSLAGCRAGVPSFQL